MVASHLHHLIVRVRSKMLRKQLGSSTKCEIAVSISALVCAEVWGVRWAQPPPHTRTSHFSNGQKIQGGLYLYPYFTYT